MNRFLTWMDFRPGQIPYKDGAQGRNRTTDTAIFSRMLYQLSYLGPVRAAAVGAAGAEAGGLL